MKIKTSEMKAVEGKLVNLIGQEKKRVDKEKNAEEELKLLNEQRELRQEQLMRDETRRQIEKQEKIMETMETLAAMKLQKMVAESQERAEVLQGNKRLRDSHAQLLKKLKDGSIEGDAFVQAEKSLLDEARAVNREKQLDYDLRGLEKMQVEA